MRILHTVPHVRNSGNGLVNVCVDLACLQSSAGHRVAVASAGGSFEALLREYGVRHYSLPHRSNPIYAIAGIRRFRHIARQFRPDIVHSHAMAGTVYAWLSRPGLRYRTVSTVHTAFRRSAVLMGLADRVVAVSSLDAETLVRRRVPRRKIDVVGNAPALSPRRSAANVSTTVASIDRPAVTTVAGLYQRKGIDVLIAAFETVFSRHPAVHLYIVGEGPDRASFAAQIERSAAREQIHLLGFMSDPTAVLEQTDVFVLASRQDPSPLVIGEARTAGCAVVATDVGGIRDALDDGAAGTLVRPNDPGMLAEAIDELLADQERLTAGKIAAASNVERFSAKHLSEAMLSLYVRLLDRLGPRGATP